MKWVISLNVIYERLLRPLNKSEGRDVIELELRSCDEFNDEKCVDKYESELRMNSVRYERLLRPLNTLYGREVIRLESMEYGEGDSNWGEEKKIMKWEWIMQDMKDYWDH